jgi:hypothetical protein
VRDAPSAAAGSALAALPTPAAATQPSRPAAKRERTVRIEQEIAAKEAALATVSAVINTPDFYRTHASPQRVFSEYAQLKRDIDMLYAKLERLEQSVTA